MITQIVGPRLKALRDERGLNQTEVARMIGVASHQIVSQIETGERRVSTDELMKLMDGLGADLDYFTDPFRLVGEGDFSWRQSGVPGDRLADYQANAGRWIAAYRHLAAAEGGSGLRKSLRLGPTATFSQAADEGERFASDYALGDVPALRLAEVMERQFDILVLAVDAPREISGAACRLPELDAVLVNRSEIAGRRHFDQAHELFHLLTWDAMPPAPVEAIDARGHVEKLANSFASALLMPLRLIDDVAWNRAGSVPALAALLNERADALQVTASALKWRLVSCRLLSRQRALAVGDDLLRHNGRDGPDAGDAPAPFSPRFMEVLGKGIQAGRVSRRRAAKLLGFDPDGDEFGDLFRAHGVPLPDTVW
jgi:transcriptional regulator with XRE-family HTH domain